MPELAVAGSIQKFRMGSRTMLAIWIIGLAILAALIAAGFCSLAL
jgi:hypothetical protein